MKQKWIITEYFKNQVNLLQQTYRLIDEDITDFYDTTFLGHTPLGKGLYKCRVVNRSIPTGKRGGFRIIVLDRKELGLIPLCIYSKRSVSDISIKEIEKHLMAVIQELS